MQQLSNSSPDNHAQGFTAHVVDALRYDGHTDDPWEVAGILQSIMPPHSHVLDVGCGTGSVTQIANYQKGNTVYGIEPDPARASIARSRGINVTVGYLSTEYLTEHKQFDVIVFADVLEHLADPAKLLQLAADGLKPNGLLLISVPNVAHWTVRIRLLFGRFDYAQVGIMDATHLRWFTAKTIRELLQRLGFEIIECKQTAGVSLPEYNSPFFTWIPSAARRVIIHGLCFVSPLLFGCQHVLKARKQK